MGVPEYLPGSIMEKLVIEFNLSDEQHGVKKVDVVKTVFVEEKPQPTQKAEKVEGETVRAAPVAEKKAAQAATSGSEKPISVLTNKPKKKGS